MKKPAVQRTRLSRFETLESRIALTVSLGDGAAADTVVVDRQVSTDSFAVSLGPIPLPASVNADGLETIHDISLVTSDDQRYRIPGGTLGHKFRIDTSESYRFSLVGNPDQQTSLSAGYRFYDIDHNEIEPLHVTKHLFATDTELSADLNPGDASLLIANASGWSNDVLYAPESRSLAWYGYADSTGNTYADYTYTRNVAHDLIDGLWAPQAIWFDASVDAYRIPLNSPWDGPTVAAGTAVRNATSGTTVGKPFPDSLINVPQWETLSVTINGEWQDGQRDELAFRPGTAFVQPFSLSTQLWNTLTFGPEQDFTSPATNLLPATGDNQFALQLDVLAKQVTSFTGDYNQDGAIDQADYSVWRSSYGAVGVVPFSGADGNGDGTVDAADYTVWRGNIGTSTSLTIDTVNASYGQATIVVGASGPTVQYLSSPWFVGTDIVEYTVRDTATGATFTSQITIDSTGSNYEQNPDTAADIANQIQTAAGNNGPTQQLNEPAYQTASGITHVADGVRNASLSDLFRDLDGDTLVFRLLSGPVGGLLEFNYDGDFEYTPNGSFTGEDSFLYEVSDGVETVSSSVLFEVYATQQELALRKLRGLSLAMLNYESSNRRFPVDSDSSFFDENGNPYLSWRVHILPFLGHDDLFSRFNLDEPWDSANNLPLLAEMPDIFRLGDDAPAYTTQALTFTGPDTPFGRLPDGLDQRGPRFQEFRDGPSRTILIAQSGVEAAVPWTQPIDMPFDPSDPLAALETIDPGGINVTTAAGATYLLPPDISPADFAGLVTLNGDELVDVGTIARAHKQSLDDLTAAESQAMEQLQDSKLKHIVLAMYNFNETRNSLPTDTLISPAGDLTQNERGLSWRVELLPFLEQEDLYAQFNRDEPWNSPHNLSLLPLMPDYFRSIGDPADSTHTRLVRPEGVETGHYNRPGSSRGGTFRGIESLSNTIAVIETAAELAVPWTKPEDPSFDINDPLSSLGAVDGDFFRAAMFDGSSVRLPSDITEDEFSELVKRRKNENVNVIAIASRVDGSETLILNKPLSTREVDLKLLAGAMLNYESTRARLPANTYAADGTPLLSWQVQLLPYLDLNSLYARFNHDEPWDSPNNLALLPLMPELFRASGDPIGSTTTRVVNFTGRENAPFPASTDEVRTGLRLADLTDGGSRTVAFLEAGPEAAAPWTKPVDRPLDVKLLSSLGSLDEEFAAAFLDGRVETLSGDITASELLALLTRNGGEDISNPPEVVIAPGVSIIQSAGDTVTNEFGADEFDVVLDKQPTTNVVVQVATADEEAASLSQSQLTFTPTNWDTPQRVIFRPVDDQVVNADRSIGVAVWVLAGASAPDYRSLAPQTFFATIVNDDPAPPALPGDYNLDGAVDAADYTLWRDQLGQANLQPYTGADADGDGTVTNADFSVWRANYGSNLLTAASAKANRLDPTTIGAELHLLEMPVKPTSIVSAAAFALVFEEMSLTHQARLSTIDQDLIPARTKDDLLLLALTLAAEEDESPFDEAMRDMVPNSSEDQQSLEAESAFSAEASSELFSEHDLLMDDTRR